MNRMKRIALYGCIVVCFLMMLLPTQAFAQTSEMNISASEIYMKHGSTHKLAVVCDTNSDLRYSSSDLRVAKVDSAGSITAVGKGEAIVSVCTADGENISVCRLFVDIEKQEAEKIEFPKVHYYQADPEWKLSYSVRKKACALTSMAMLLKNSGIDTDPAKAYQHNGKNTGMIYKRVLKHYDKQYDCAVPYDSEYLLTYSSADGKTVIKNPAKNYEAAIGEALERHPEGVLCYFVNGHGSHAVVAISAENGKIYYNDPGRKAQKGEHITFEDTWCAYRHNMNYGDLAYMIAIN